MKPVIKKFGKLKQEEKELAKMLNLSDWEKWEDFILHPAELLAAQEKFFKGGFNSKSKEIITMFGPYFDLARSNVAKQAPHLVSNSTLSAVPVSASTELKKSGKLNPFEYGLAVKKLELPGWRKWEHFVNRPAELLKAEEKFCRGNCNTANRTKVYLTFSAYFDLARSNIAKKVADPVSNPPVPVSTFPARKQTVKVLESNPPLSDPKFPVPGTTRSGVGPISEPTNRGPVLPQTLPKPTRLESKPRFTVPGSTRTGHEPILQVVGKTHPGQKLTVPVSEPTQPSPKLTVNAAGPSIIKNKIPNFKKKKNNPRKACKDEKECLKPSTKKIKLMKEDCFGTERKFDSAPTTFAADRLILNF